MMATTTVIILAIIVLTLAILYGIPIPYAFAAPAILFVMFLSVNTGVLIPTIFGQVKSVVLLAIPFYIMCGGIMEKGHIGEALINWIETFTGRLKGGLLAVTTVTSAVFGSVCGSGSATVACMGTILAPRMKNDNYPEGLYAAVICCSGTLGLLIPPSALQIIYGWCTNTSIAACFLAIVGPGIMLTALLTITALIMVRKAKGIKPHEKKEGNFLPRLGKNTFTAVPALIMPVIILGGIYGGIMTPTEAGAVATIYAVFAGMFIYKKIKMGQLRDILVSTSVTTGVVLMLLTFASVISRLFLQEGLSDMLMKVIYAVSDEKWAVLMMVNLCIILVGMITDDVCGVLLVAPIFAPICVSVGVTPVQFAAIIGVNLGMGNITPPCAPFIFLTSRITGVEAAKIMKYSIPLILFAYVPTLIATTYWAPLSMWLPNLLMGGKF